MTLTELGRRRAARYKLLSRIRWWKRLARHERAIAIKLDRARHL